MNKLKFGAMAVDIWSKCEQALLPSRVNGDTQCSNHRLKSRDMLTFGLEKLVLMKVFKVKLSFQSFP